MSLVPRSPALRRRGPLRRALRAVAAVLLAWLLVAAPSAHAQEAGVPEADLVDAGWTPPPDPAGWVTLASGHATLHGDAAHDRLLRELAAHADEALPRLAHELGVATGGPVEIWLAATADDFRALQPGAAPPWADGTAYPRLGAIFLRHPDLRGGMARPLEQVLDHELVHVLLGRAFAPDTPPAWLQEGVAQVLAGEAGPTLTERLSRGMLQGPIPLTDLEDGFPRGPGRADLAYAESADFVQWLQVEHGADALPALVAQVRQGAGLSQAVHAVTGADLASVQEAWLARLVRTTPVWTSPQQFEAFLFGGAALAALLAGWVRRRRIQQRLATWRRDDATLDRLAREVLNARHADATDP